MTRAAIAVVSLLVLSLLAPAGAVAAETGDPVTLTISVVDQSGAPVGDAELTATWENGSTTETTASNGKAFVDVPKDATVEITISHPEYIRNHAYVVENATERDVEVAVSRRGELRVVVDDANGAVADARVILRMDGRIAVSGTTDGDGVYESGDVERGDYTVSVVKPGYFRNTTSVTVDDSARTRLLIERGSVTLTVVVRDPHFSPAKPVGGATVAIDSVGQFTTLPEGKASVSVPVNTDLSIEVTKEGYEEVSHDVSVRESDHRENVSLSRVPSISIEPVNRRVVAGEKVVVAVTDEYGTPVEGATVTLDGDSVGETDGNGQLGVAVEETGDHTLVARASGLRSEGVTVTAIAADGETATPTSTPTDSSTDTPTSTGVGGPGFTPATALLALVLAALAVAFVRRR
ncbi:MAG: carboxypeptidase-like regulatory domain-containing protein [Haloferacaceae archaeon]